MTHLDDEDAISIYMTREDALKVADLLSAYGDDEDQNLAENIRYQARLSGKDGSNGERERHRS